MMPSAVSSVRRITVWKSLGPLAPPANARSGTENPATYQKYQRGVPGIMKVQKPVKRLMLARNDHRSCGNSAISVSAAKLPTRVPASRSRPLLIDSSTVDSVQNATEKPAQYGLLQSMDRAMP